MTVSSLSRPADHGTAEGVRLRWPLPALLVWAACWLLMAGLAALGAPPAPTLAVALGACVLCAWGWPRLSPWRRMLLAAGFLAGSAIPPVGSVLRALWPSLMAETPDLVTTAYALDSVVVELAFMVGPLVVGEPAEA